MNIKYERKSIENELKINNSPSGGYSLEEFSQMSPQRQLQVNRREMRKFWKRFDREVELGRL